MVLSVQTSTSNSHLVCSARLGLWMLDDLEGSADRLGVEGSRQERLSCSPYMFSDVQNSVILGDSVKLVRAHLRGEESFRRYVFSSTLAKTSFTARGLEEAKERLPEQFAIPCFL